MRHLGEEIIQDGYCETSFKCRDAARGIILNDKKEILFIYSSHYNDVSMPGGGVDSGEDLITALKRECLEEVGAIISSYKEFYKITEKRKLHKEKHNVFTSYYYICEYEKLVETSLLDYEIKLGYENRWMTIDDAISLNENTLERLISNNSYTGVIVRELRILYQLKKELL